MDMFGNLSVFSCVWLQYLSCACIMMRFILIQLNGFVQSHVGGDIEKKVMCVY